MKKIITAKKMNLQTKNDPNYKPMSPNFDRIAFKAACRLVLEELINPLDILAYTT